MPKLNQKTQPDIEKFQERLRELIAETGLSQRKVAVKSGLNPYIISKALRGGEMPSMRSLVKLADMLKVSLAYLLGESDKREYQRAEHPVEFKDRIAQLAEENNVKYSEISRGMPFAHNAIYEWVRTETVPSLGYMKAIAEYFGVSLDYMTGRSDVKN